MRVCSFFSGIGGIDIAFTQAGCTTVYANDVDSFACSTYRHNFPLISLVEKDIQDIVADTIPDFDVLVAGFPCQPFSICGRQNGFNDKRGNLFYDIIRTLKVKRPRIVFLENVSNLANHDNGRTLNTIFFEMAQIGYFIRYNIADACDYGVPQHRTRIYITAFLNVAECSRFSFPQKENLSVRIFDVINTSKEANKNLYFSPGTKAYEYLQLHIRDDKQLYRFSDYGIQSSKNGISFTLKANMGTWPNREPIVKDSFGIRKLSPRECLSLQGFPSWFTFPDSVPERKAYAQAGNTVCVPIVYKIVEQIKIAVE